MKTASGAGADESSAAANDLGHFLQVLDKSLQLHLPGFLVWRAEYGRWMDGGHHEGSQGRFHELAALQCDAKVFPEQGLSRCGAEANDHFRLDRCDFRVEPWPA